MNNHKFITIIFFSISLFASDVTDFDKNWYLGYKPGFKASGSGILIGNYKSNLDLFIRFNYDKIIKDENYTIYYDYDTQDSILILDDEKNSLYDNQKNYTYQIGITKYLLKNEKNDNFKAFYISLAYYRSYNQYTSSSVPSYSNGILMTDSYNTKDSKSSTNKYVICLGYMNETFIYKNISINFGYGINLLYNVSENEKTYNTYSDNILTDFRVDRDDDARTELDLLNLTWSLKYYFIK